MGKIEKSFYYLCFFLAIYITISFKLIPIVLKDQLVKNLNENLTLKTSIEKVEFNPFTLEAKIHKLALNDKNGNQSIYFSQFKLNIALLRSILELHISLDEILLKDTLVNVVENLDGSINLSKILKEKKEKIEEKPKKDETSSDIKFLISKIKIENLNINYNKITINGPYKLFIKDVNYTLYDVGTHNNSLASNHLELNINEHTKLDLRGAFNISPFKMYGKAKIIDLRLKEILNHQKEILNFDINKEARFDLDLDYNINTKDDFDLKINTTKLKFSNINLKQNKTDVIKLEQVLIGNLKFDLIKQDIKANDIEIKALKTKLIVDKNGANLANLFKATKESKKVKKKVKKKEEKKSNEEKTAFKPWKISLSNIKQINSDFIFSNKLTNMIVETKKFNTSVSKINVKGSDIYIAQTKLNTPNILFKDLKNKLNIQTKDTILTANNLDINGSKISLESASLINPKLNIEDITNNLKLDVSKIDANINSFLLNNNNISIKTAKIKKGKLKIEDRKNELNIYSSNAEVNINRFRQSKNNLSLSSIRVYDPSVTVINKKDKTNIIAKNIDISVSGISNNKSGLKVLKTDISKPNISIILEKNISKNASKKEIEKAKNKKTKESDAKLNIGPIIIKNATLSFEDKNLPLPFKTTISALSGKVSRLNTIVSSTSKLKVDGVVDKYGTTQITGIVNPKSLKILTDINMIFKNISMQNFTPYTSKFIGKELANGKLDLDLKYNIDKSNLDAKNNIIITKLKLGKKVESKDAVSLPLELAIALLEDRNGVIDLSIPVSGNMDDPQFSIAPIVWKAFVNLITKAITAPFSLLGSIFGFEADEINSVNFLYSEEDITPIQKETLDKVSEILLKRPNLVLEFDPSYEKNKDKEALKRKKFNKLVTNELPNKQKKDYEEDYLDLLEDLYEDYDKKLKTLKKKYPNDLKAYKKELETFIISEQEVKKSELSKLALNRVANIKKYLLEEKKIPSKQIRLSNKIKIKTSSDKTSNIDLKISK